MIAIYPGTFDPITNGHIDIIKRAKKIFDTVVVAVAKSAEKVPMFSIEQRVKLVKDATTTIDGVEVEKFETLLVDFASLKKSHIIIRGLRAVSDFEYELQMGYANSSLSPEIETLYFMPSLENAFISSSVVRSIIKHNGEFRHLVPKSTYELIKDRDCI